METGPKKCCRTSSTRESLAYFSICSHVVLVDEVLANVLYDLHAINSSTAVYIELRAKDFDKEVA